MSMKPCEITDRPIDLDRLKEAIREPSCGGHAIFVGTVRNGGRRGEVVRLEYEAYVSMAEKVLDEIAAETAKKFGAKIGRIVHRVGVIEPGEVSVVVVFSSPHRKEAFEACSYAVNELKRRAPIWKKEVYRDGKSEWTGGTHDVELG
ncbi:MAG: molybdenum cofactor biosynthesis protein MoaE [Pseudomonadota bacterium]